jgi:hypothetical protein
MVDLYCASYPAPPVAVTLDIDDTVDVVHGHQQLSFFNAHYDERCFLPIHVYDTASGRPVAVILRPGKTPSGREVRGHLRRLVRRIRKHWPHTHLTIRGDGHYSRPEVMAWCEENGLDFVFGLPGNAILAGAVEAAADDIRTRRALDQKPSLRGWLRNVVKITDPNKPFYSHRHTATSYLRNTRLPDGSPAVKEDIERYILGHAGKGAHAGYGKRWFETLKAAVEVIPNPLKDSVSAEPIRQ